MTAVLASRERQRFRALDGANDIRVRRHRLKDELRDGTRGVESVLREPEWWLFSLPVHELLGWLPGVGPTRVNRVLRRAEVWPLREVGRLTLRQRLRLLLELERGGLT